MIVTLFNAVSAMAAFTAAGLWWRSTVIAVPFDHEIPEDGWRPAAILASGPKGDIDVFKTQDAANALNNRAAKAAALAAACQGTAIALPILQDMFHALV